MRDLAPPGLRILAIALPIVFAIHVAEEAPGFVAWFNSLVTPGITQRLFLSVNATALLIAIAIASLVATSRHTGVCIGAIEELHGVVNRVFPLGEHAISEKLYRRSEGRWVSYEA